MDTSAWGLAPLGVGLCVTVLAATQVGPPATMLYTFGLPTTLAGVVLLERTRRR